MLLYHYATAAFPLLKTTAQQRELTDVEREEAKKEMIERSSIKPYHDHISFFFDPVPLDIIAGLFSAAPHKFWFAGNRIYEHVVESRNIGAFDFDVVEVPAEIVFMEKNWSDDFINDVSRYTKYYAERREMRKRLGLEGSGNADFERAVKPYAGKTRRYFMDAWKHNDEGSMKLYAASVPHVLLYPETGIVRPIKPAKLFVIPAPAPQPSHEHRACSAKW